MSDEATVVNPPVESTGGSTAVSDPNYQKRINDLMSRGDKLQDQLNKLQETHTNTVLEKAEYQRKVSELTGQIEKNTQEIARVQEVSTKAVEDAMRRLQERDAEMESVRAENARLKIIAENPDLAHFADLIPATTDVEKLTGAIEKIRNARNRDLETVKTQLTAGQTQALNPSRVQVDLDPTQVGEYLREGQKISDAEYEKRLREVTQMPLQRKSR